MSCHGIFKNLCEPKTDVIFTSSFKITAEIEITKHTFCVLLCFEPKVPSSSPTQYLSFFLSFFFFSVFCFVVSY